MPARLLVDPLPPTTKPFDDIHTDEHRSLHGRDLTAWMSDPHPPKLRREVASGRRARSGLEDRPGSPAEVSTVGDARLAGLLPTPPMNVYEESRSASQQGAPDEEDLDRTAWDRSHTTPGVSTPLNQRRPPTPDTTPPSDPPKYSGLLPPRDQRAPSSRTESFKTAQEEQASSDDEADRPPLPWPDALLDRDQDRTPLAGPRAIDLEAASVATPLAVDSDKTPTQEATGHNFYAFDGDWGRRERSEPSSQASDAAAKRNAQLDTVGCTDHQSEEPRTEDEAGRVKVKKKRVRKKAEKRPPAMAQANVLMTPGPAGAPVETPLRRHSGRGPSLRERIRQNQNAENRNSTKSFAEKIDWPLPMEDTSPDAPAPATENKRNSGLSTTSTVIEALLVLDRPKRPRPLRHAGRNIAFGDREAARVRAVTAPELTNPPPFRLTHKSDIPDMKRASLASERSITPPPVEKAAAPAPESIPALVIPKQRHPARSTGAGPKFPERLESRPLNFLSTDSLGTSTIDSADSHSRDYPHRAPYGHAVGTPGGVGHALRGQESSSRSAKKGGRRSTSTPALFGGDNVDDAAAARREVSEGNPSRYKTREPNMAQHPGMRGGPSATSHMTPPLHSRSPFSGLSTPEALEVSQATAVSIYPHNNNSLLVVRQHSRPVSREIQQVAAVKAVDTLPSSSRIRDGERPSMERRDLRLPPTFHVIPPTPSIMTPVDDHDRQLGRRGSVASTGEDKQRGSGGAISLVKRAFSNTRYVDSFVSPFARFKAANGHDESPYGTGRRRGSRQRQSSANGKDSTLSPFWRPRGFWDDLEVDDADVQDEFLDRGRVELFEPEVIQERRRSRSASAVAAAAENGSSASPKLPSHGWDDDHRGRSERGRNQSQARSSSSTSSFSSSRRQITSDGHHSPRAQHRRVYLIPPLGVQVEFVGWRGMQKRLRQGKASRSEEMREQERRRIKHRISTPTVVHQSRAWP